MTGAPLEYIASTEYILYGERCHITVNNIIVEIVKNDEGVSLYTHPLEGESTEPLTENWVLYSEAEEDEPA